MCINIIYQFLQYTVFILENLYRQHMIGGGRGGRGGGGGAGVGKTEFGGLGP